MSDDKANRGAWVAGVVAAVSVLGVAAYAQDSPRVLHEYFNPWTLEEGAPEDAEPRGAGGATALGSQGSAAPPERRASGAGAPPPLRLNPGADEVVLGPEGPVDRAERMGRWGPLSPRGSASTLDEDTDRVDQLNYFANFDPSIMPYKRGVVQNAVRLEGGRYTAVLDSQRLRELKLPSPRGRQGLETFWGSFALRTEPGELHPLPSVAAEQIVLELQAEPAVGLEMVRDEADNYYLRTEHRGLLRLNLKLGAPRFYFDGKPAGGVQWGQMETSRTPSLPTPARRAGQRVLAMLGVDRSMNPLDALDALVSWYRDFEARPLPDDLRQGDLFVAVSNAQIGVCRHRSLAFMVAARTLGIPTRYVYNEAHAFVEVHWPGQGWRRIDLGGSAADFDFASNGANSLHEASFEDRFPQPPNYLEELRRQAEEFDTPELDSLQSASGSSQEAGPMQMSSSQEELAMSGLSGGEGRSLEGRGERADARVVEDDDLRRRVEVSVLRASPEAFRGRSLRVYGTVKEPGGEPLGGAIVDVLLGPVGTSTAQTAVLLGQAKTDSRGIFDAEFAVPAQVGIGRWSVSARFAGSQTHRPANSE